MADIKPFQCIRREKELAKHVGSLPYDVFNRSEACEKVKGRELLFLNIDRPETQFDDSEDTYADVV